MRSRDAGLVFRIKPDEVQTRLRGIRDLFRERLEPLVRAASECRARNTAPDVRRLPKIEAKIRELKALAEKADFLAEHVDTTKEVLTLDHEEMCALLPSVGGRYSQFFDESLMEVSETEHVGGVTPAAFQLWTEGVDTHPREPRLAYGMSWTLALASEAGEVAGKVDKIFRDHGPHLAEFAMSGQSANFSNQKTAETCLRWREDFSRELGDVLHCVARVAAAYDIDFDGLLAENVGKIEDRKARGMLGGSGDRR